MSDFLTNDPNDRIAPWFGSLDIETQLHGKKLDFLKVLSKLDPDGSEIFSNTFIDVFGGVKTVGFRNKNKFTFGYTLESIDQKVVDNYTNVILGFIGESYPLSYIISYEKACTIDDNFKTICRSIEEIVKQSTIKPYLGPPFHKKKKKGKNKNNEENSKDIIVKHRGVWKYVTIRSTVYESMYMVTMTNYVKNITDDDNYTETLKQISDKLNQLIFVKSFHVCEYKDTVEPQPGDPLRAMFTKQSFLSEGYPRHHFGGQGSTQMHKESQDYCGLPDNVLVEKIMNRYFVISPNSFFQVNTETTEILYQKIREMFACMIGMKGNSKKNILIDMYCGTGSIGICLADMFDHVIGIDVIESSIRDAELNAKINRINNCEFILGRCEDLISRIKNDIDKYSDPANIYLIVDPSREGLHKKVKQFIKNLDFSGFVYCSCNVKSWGNDIEQLSQNIIPCKTLIVDMFPHTQHYEVLSCFLKN